VNALDVLREHFRDELGWDSDDAEAEYAALADLDALVQAAQTVRDEGLLLVAEETIAFAAALARVKGEQP
jgi:hypothetical protein